MSSVKNRGVFRVIAGIGFLVYSLMHLSNIVTRGLSLDSSTSIRNFTSVLTMSIYFFLAVWLFIGKKNIVPVVLLSIELLLYIDVMYLLPIDFLLRFIILILLIGALVRKFEGVLIPLKIIWFTPSALYLLSLVSQVVRYKGSIISVLSSNIYWLPYAIGLFFLGIVLKAMLEEQESQRKEVELRYQQFDEAEIGKPVTGLSYAGNVELLMKYSDLLNKNLISQNEFEIIKGKVMKYERGSVKK